MDTELRKAEREGGAALLKAKIRAGYLSSVRVRTAARLGHEESLLLYPEEQEIDWLKVRVSQAKLYSFADGSTKPQELRTLDHEEKEECIRLLTNREQNELVFDLLKGFLDVAMDPPPGALAFGQGSHGFTHLFRDLERLVLYLRDIRWKEIYEEPFPVPGMSGLTEAFTPTTVPVMIASKCNELLNLAKGQDNLREAKRQKELLISLLLSTKS